MSQTEVFISQFSEWSHKISHLQPYAKRISPIMRRIILDELPSRDDTISIMIRDLTNSSSLKCSFNSNEVWCQNIDNQHVLTGVVFPYWRRGLREICKNDYIYDEISWFFHFASQYIARSRIIDIIGAIALTYDKACDFRGATLSEVYTRNDIDEINRVKQEHFSNINNKTEGKQRYFSTLCNMLNSLDPYVNRIVYQYVRAIELYNNEFLEETITALDCVVNVAEQFVRERMKISESNQRSALIKAFKINPIYGMRLERLYQLRCYFGSHPSMSKWWDFSEIYGDDFDELFDAVKNVIINVIRIENQYRVVDKNPKSWSSWFNQNVLMLWNSVWFHKIPY